MSVVCLFFFVKQKTAYEVRISDWSSDVCSSDLWVLGGIDNVAAYLPGVAVGDTGAYGALDLLYHGWQLAGVRFSPRVFVEYGLSRYEQQSDAATRGTSMMSDVGGELQASWRFLETSLALAAPIPQRRVSSSLPDDSEAHLLFMVTANSER